MAIVKKNNLNRFSKRLMNYKGKINRDEIVELVGNIGVEIATDEYQGKINDITSIDSSNGTKIVAKGEKIAYMEFGTGVTGRNTYDGTLPTQKLVFESPKGVRQSTEGWQYNYRKEQGQTEKDFIGHVAEAQMFKTAQRLRTELPSKIKQKIKGE